MQVKDKGDKAKGSIPEKLTIWTRKDYKHEFYNESVVCSAAMVTDAASKPSQKTAKSWAMMNYVYDAVEDEADLVSVTVDNEKIPWLRVVGLDLRTKGGRAWKVVTPENYLVDLRDDVLLDILFTKGVPKGGKIKGPFLWIKLGSQMRLVQVNSTMHKAVIKSQKEREKEKSRKAKLKASSLQIGGIYYSESNRTYKVYVGRVRYRKKLGWLWYDPPHGRINEVKTFEGRYGRGRPDFTFTSSVFPVTLHKVVDLPEVPVDLINLQDGYGSPILIEDVNFHDVPTCCGLEEVEKPDPRYEVGKRFKLKDRKAGFEPARTCKCAHPAKESSDGAPERG